MNVLKLKYVNDQGAPKWLMFDGDEYVNVGSHDGLKVYAYGDRFADKSHRFMLKEYRNPNPRGDEEIVLYQLLTPVYPIDFMEGIRGLGGSAEWSTEARPHVILVKQTADKVVLLGKASVQWDKMAEWAGNLINKDAGVDPDSFTSADGLRRYVKLTPESMAAKVLADLEEWVNKGPEGQANSAYTDFDDYWGDEIADLPWDQPGRKIAINWILAQTDRLGVLVDKLAEQGVDIKKLLIEARDYE